MNRATPDVPPDRADAIAEAWERERPGTPADSIGVVTRIWWLGKLFGDDRRRTLAAAGVDAATLDLLSELRRVGPPYRLTTRDLATRSRITAGAVSQRVARAERAGLVRREPGAARTVVVALTETGHDLVERTVDQVLGREAELLADLPSAERDALAATLRHLLARVTDRLGVPPPGQVGEE